MAIETPIWIYWLGCVLAGVIIAINRQKLVPLLSPELYSSHPRNGYFFSLILGWSLTIFGAVFYILLTLKQVQGNYQLKDLIFFSMFNGVFEQLMFVFWFLIGCLLASTFHIQKPWKVFGLGILSYSIFSGAIHALFWVNVLPPHQPALVTPFLLTAMSVAWMWLFWRYQAIVAIIAMHIMIDFLTIGHLHFSWFETFQLV